MQGWMMDLGFKGQGCPLFLALYRVKLGPALNPILAGWALRFGVILKIFLSSLELSDKKVYEP